MYNLNTDEGKKQRIEGIKVLVSKLSKREKLELDEEVKIIEYLNEIKRDLEWQLKK